MEKKPNSEMTECADLLLGIDGGGTKTVFKLTDLDGNVLNRVTKGAANPNDIGIEAAKELLKDGISEVCQGIPLSRVTMFAGIAGGGLSGNNAEILNRFFAGFGFNTFENGSDIENLVSLADREECVLVIMGTGFVVFALNGNERKRVSGWGQFFDEGGSGYTIGRDCITAVLCESDGSGKKTMLSRLLEDKAGRTAEENLAEFYRGGKKYIADFSDIVFLGAEQNDGVAKEILDKNMEFAACKIMTAVRTFGKSCETIPVFVSGGLTNKSEILFPIIKKHLGNTPCELIKLEAEPVDGAVARAKKIFTENGEEKTEC